MYSRQSCSRTAATTKVSLPRSQQSTSSSLITNLSSSKTNVHDSEFVYVDCLFHNTSNVNFENIQFEASRTTPILSERNNYKLGVISVAGNIIVPLLTPGPVIIGMSWKIPDAAGGTTGFTHVGDVLPTIYSAEEYVTFYNGLLSTLWAGTITEYNAAGGNWAGDPGIPTQESGLVYDNTTQTFTLYGDLSFTDQFPTISKARLEFGNVTVGQLFGLNFDFGNLIFPQIGFTPVNFTKGFEDTNLVTLNGIIYVENVQDSPTIGSWNQTNSIVLISNSLGARRVEFARSFDTATNSTDNTVNIIDSFPISLNGGLNHFVTFANPNINYSDITSNGPLDRLTFSIYTVQNTGDIYPLKAPPLGTVTVKLVFARTTFTSN